MPASNSAVETYLAKAARRRQWVEFGNQVVRLLWILGGLFLIWLLLARLSAVISDSHAWAFLAGLPIVAVVIAGFTHRRVSSKEAATVVDRYEGNHDLFLTAVHLDESSGGYQEKVRERAEAKAKKEAPLGKMIPWSWQKPCLRLLAGLFVLVAGLLFLPQLDPFGKEETRDWLTKQEERLEELRKKNEEARALLKREETEQRAEEIAQALAKLEQTFQLARPEQQEATRKALRDQQKALGKFWKQLDDEKLTKALDKESDRWQTIGQSEATMSPEAKAMRDELREMLRSGDAKKLQDRLAEMLERVEKQQQQQQQSGGSAEEQAKERAALKDSLQELASAISEVAPSDPLKASLQRAIEQMQMAQNTDLQGQAMQGAQESMEQLQKQVGALAEQLKQLSELESGMDAAQLAQQLNELGQMSGQKPGGSGMKSYADLYKELLAESQGGGGEGRGPGMRGPGSGEGGVAPEDDSLVTGFKKEQSPSHLVAGKTLLQWQTNDVSEAGQATEAYQESLKQLKQGLSEAIRQEKVPAGYHDQIQRYFDTLKEAPSPEADDLD